MKQRIPPDQKIITVSGLYSGIGKTELCQHIVSLAPGIGAIKVTINDKETAVLDDEASIMVSGKDTCRLRESGAAKVVWVRAQEERLAEALAEALSRVSGCSRLLIEGNSVLAHITPDIAVFVCDSRMCSDKPLKPSRVTALRKADIIINNMRRGSDAAVEQVQGKARQINGTAPVIAIDITNRAETVAFLKKLFEKNGFITP